MARSTLLTWLLALLSFIAAAQPAGYVPGTQVCWTFNDRPHGYFRAAGNGERHILISFTGNGETSCTNYQAQAPQKWLRDVGVNWDGRTVRAPGDTVVWEVFTLVHNSSTATDLEYFFANMAYIDTSDHTKFHIEGLSGGVGRMWSFMLGTSPWRNLFSTTISQSGVNVGALSKVGPYSVGKRHWVWYGEKDRNGGTPLSASQKLYDSLRGTKYFTLQANGAHNGVTWDSCMSLKGHDTTRNRWLWMIAGSQPVPPQPPVVVDPYPGGGPFGYTAGTQVCWSYNNRPHGYFRAAGNGERHILIAFTNTAEDSCDNYQNQSPQKLFNDNGINWDGRTVRAPGDTVVWEVLTILNTNNNFMGAYAGDINYFFTHIFPVDTTDHSKFHITGIGSGAGRFWGYVTNDQAHNSPYRDLFSTTISTSIGVLGTTTRTKVKAYSLGRRHWVWHGLADATNNPSYSQRLYDSLSGDKRFTWQAGGGHDSTTWDSCYSLNGSTTNDNRWLWMVTAGSAAKRRVSNEAEIITNNELSIYPNPGYDKVNLRLNQAVNGTYTIRITDGMGRVQKMISQARGNNYVLDIASLPKGIYFIEVRSGEQVFRQKLLKE